MPSRSSGRRRYTREMLEPYVNIEVYNELSYSPNDYDELVDYISKVDSCVFQHHVDAWLTDEGQVLFSEIQDKIRKLRQTIFIRRFMSHGGVAICLGAEREPVTEPNLFVSEVGKILIHYFSWKKCSGFQTLYYKWRELQAMERLLVPQQERKQEHTEFII